MTSRVTHLKGIALLLALAAALAAPTAAVAGKPEAKQFALYLSGILPPKTTPAASGRAEAKQIAAYLKGTVNLLPSPTQSARAETTQIATYLRGVVRRAATPAVSGQAEAKALAEYLSAPVVTSYLHNDAFPASHPLMCGPLGYQGSKAAMKLIAQADVVLALGTRLGPFGTLPQHGIEYWPKNARIIQVDSDHRMLGLVKPITVGVCGDAKPAAAESTAPTRNPIAVPQPSLL